MPQLIRNGQVVNDDWDLIETLPLDHGFAQNEAHQGKVIVPLDYWREHQAQLSGLRHIGVWIDGDTDLSPIGADISKQPLVAVRFPAFMDGRGFSTGRLMRERYQFTGELRAIGHFIRDQLCYLRRCGFNAFQFHATENLSAALDSLSDFQDYYQACNDEPLPLFRRRT